MCLAIPMRVTAIVNNRATVEVGGAEYSANLDLLDDVAIGDYLIIHAGFAIEKLDEAAAQESLAIWREIAEYSNSGNYKKRPF
jgi:hydrogenase expression/formation protein HypC